MARILTTRLFACQRALYEMIGRLPFPGAPVPVSLGEPEELTMEYVGVFTSGSATTEPRTGNRVTESFGLRVRVQTDAHHRTAVDASKRLEDLVATVERLLRGPDGAAFTFDGFPDLGDEVILRTTASGRTITTRGPMPIEGGWGAEADIEFQVQAVI